MADNATGVFGAVDDIGPDACAADTAAMHVSGYRLGP